MIGNPTTVVKTLGRLLGSGFFAGDLRFEPGIPARILPARGDLKTTEVMRPAAAVALESLFGFEA